MKLKKLCHANDKEGFKFRITERTKAEASDQM